MCPAVTLTAVCKHKWLSQPCTNPSPPPLAGNEKEFPHVRVLIVNNNTSHANHEHTPPPPTPSRLPPLLIDQVKAVLRHLEETLTEVSSLGQQGAAIPCGSSFYGGRSARAATAAGGRAGSRRTEAGVEGAGEAGVSGIAALPTWQQLLDRVRTLSRCAEWW